jgi:hypothetical protein
LCFSDSRHSTEDSDFRIDDPEEAAAYEIKKRKIDETGDDLSVVPVPVIQGRLMWVVAILLLRGSL